MMLVLLVAALCSSWLGTAALRRYALSGGLLDQPNARSSHQVPTPRGGGLAFVVVFLLGCLALQELGLLGASACGVLVGAGLLVAILGFVDDHRHVGAGWRLLGHFVAALVALLGLGGYGVLSTVLAGMTGLPAWLVLLVGALYLVWLLNLYNFMDGIDGIAAIEALTACLGMALIYAFVGLTALLGAPLLLAAAVGGFLLWNFPPARIFMGDVGSGFLGLILGILSLQAAMVQLSLFWAWLILLAVFVVDATWTLLRRLSRGKKPYEAHRTHAYQWASRRHGAHRPVTLAVLLINTCWLLPIALLVGAGRLSAILGLILAYGPLLCLALRYNAGADEVVTSAQSSGLKD
ncbi:Fuc2NAc and GlcNAc transferase [Pseudomonas psychrotolerans]|uniref:Fuc2NAc and GlcNAc transferase n=2 Tax=Pseudomonas oryzihabitans TaxID=47885 RepID=A0AAJ2C115_9PSED|nr:Fuc2NAc and GlcNAc transferase [Pseudomonas psychrotolerans]MDR6354570.1 Fuc2NAc and GlcNAc transferase [Pseudomonas psychrotolerans]